jgi:hypothetical protein
MTGWGLDGGEAKRESAVVGQKGKQTGQAGGWVRGA